MVIAGTRFPKSRSLRLVAVSALFSTLAASGLTLVRGGTGFLVSTGSLLVVLVLVVWGIGSLLIQTISFAFPESKSSRVEAASRIGVTVAGLLVIPLAYEAAWWGANCVHVLLNEASYQHAIAKSTQTWGADSVAVVETGGMLWSGFAYVYDGRDHRLFGFADKEAPSISELQAERVGCATYNVIHLFSHWYYVGCGS